MLIEETEIRNVRMRCVVKCVVKYDVPPTMERAPGSERSESLDEKRAACTPQRWNDVELLFCPKTLVDHGWMEACHRLK